jgi:DNA helicase-2/ATP-dependent DNA helicase PcrA
MQLCAFLHFSFLNEIRIERRNAPLDPYLIHGKIRPVDILSNLNLQQRMAVTAPDGPVVVLAGPGSGKTRVITARVAYLIQQMGVRPYQILVVTFTNKAARELEKRVVQLAEGALVTGEPLPKMGTFHAICAQIMRREAEYLPVDRDFVIFDADDQLTLVKRAMKDLNIDEKLYKPSGIHAAISMAKNDKILPKEYLSYAAGGANRQGVNRNRDNVIARVYAKYQEMLQFNNAVDFDDLLLYTCRLLEQNIEVREKYSRRYQYILVDEFQDTNAVQYELLKLLTSAHQNIFVVGDEDQSIYRWRGADYRNVLRFEEDYPRAQKILLEQNYRSTQNVLDAASAVINRNSNRTVKRLRSLPDRGQGDKLTLFEAESDHAEAAYVVDTIQQLVNSRRNGAGDFVIMYRTNSMSRLLEEAFLRAGIPYRLVGAQRFYGRREIKDLIGYLRLIHNPADEISLNRVINVPPRGIGDKTLLLLQQAAQEAQLPVGNVVMDLGRLGKQSPYWGVFARGAAQLSDFGAHLVAWHESVNNGPLPELFDQILEEIGYHEHLDDGTEEGRSRWENVQELRRLAFEYAERGLTAFLENLALVSDQDTVPEETEAPTLLTLHAAKGLEFPVVFIIGLDDGILPHSRSLEEPEEMAEERRLFYVGLTRARSKIYLVRAEERSTYGAPQESDASRFLHDLPEDLLAQDNRRKRGSGSYRRSTTWDDSNRTSSRSSDSGRSSSSRSAGSGRSAGSDSGYNWSSNRSSEGQGRALRTYTTPPPPGGAAPISEPRFRAGMRVRHAQWADGLVIESRLQDGDEVVAVAFESVGIKRLMASLANLEIISK